MTIYVAAIKGRGIAAFEAGDHTAADIRVRDCMFRDDLMVLATDGVPLWDGVTNIDIRQALPDEEAKWRAAHAKAIRRGDIDETDEHGFRSWSHLLISTETRDNPTGWMWENPAEWRGSCEISFYPCPDQAYRWASASAAPGCDRAADLAAPA
jgi:hypothetical protein